MKNKRSGLGVVKYSNTAEFVLDYIHDLSCSSFNPRILREYEVIGNIYDNKKLLEEG